MNRPLLFPLDQMAALGDLIASLNKNGISYELAKDDNGVEIRIGKGF